MGFRDAPAVKAREPGFGNAGAGAVGVIPKQTTAHALVRFGHMISPLDMHRQLPSSCCMQVQNFPVFSPAQRGH